MDGSGREKILVCLCGLSPAVITETVWALQREGTCPNHVMVITTTAGEKCIRNELISSGVWEHLRAELAAPAGNLKLGSRSSIRVIPDESNENDAADVKLGIQSAVFGDFVLQELRGLTENPDTEIIFSIAGGRKSMSAIALQCMSLLARPCDTACHVLVNSPFDRPLSPGFFYPTKSIHKLMNADGSVHSQHPGAEAKLILHDIPFIRCREIFQKEHSRLPGTFRQTVDAANSLLTPPEIHVDENGRAALVDGTSHPLTEIQFFLFSYFYHHPGEAFDSDSLYKQLELYRHDSRFINVRSNISSEWVRKHYSELKKRLPPGILIDRNGVYGILPDIPGRPENG